MRDRGEDEQEKDGRRGHVTATRLTKWPLGVTKLVRDQRSSGARAREAGRSSGWSREEAHGCWAWALGLLFGCFGHEDEDADTQGGARARERPGVEAAWAAAIHGAALGG